MEDDEVSVSCIIITSIKHHKNSPKKRVEQVSFYPFVDEATEAQKKM